MASKEIMDRAVELLGPAQPVSKPTLKEDVMSFRNGHVYVALKMVTPFDREKNEYGEAFPRITFLVDGKYVRMPIDSDLLTSLGNFLVKMGDVLEGVRIPEKEINVEDVRNRILELTGGLQ